MRFEGMDRRGNDRLDPRRVVGYLFVAGMVLAPFLALTFSIEVGLAVMTFALAATTYLAFDALKHAQPELHSRLKLMAGINALLCLACLLILLARSR